jgi:uncharacterized protein YjbJ (UPF0337 family)
VDKDTIKGKMKDAGGRIERQVGEWTDDEKMQSEGAGKQVEGKAQKGIGKLKEMGRDIKDKVERKTDQSKDDLKHRDRDVA